MAPLGDQSSFFGCETKHKMAGSKFRKSAGRGQVHDAYSVLGVPRNANKNTIKSVYRKLALEHHPDKIPISPKSTQEQIKKARSDASSRFAEISAAYEILSDEEEKKRYDYILRYGGSQTSSGSFRTAYTTSTPGSTTYKRKVYPTYQKKDDGKQRERSGESPSNSRSNQAQSTSITYVSETPDGLRKFATVTTQIINGKKSIREEIIYSNGRREVRINTNPTEGQDDTPQINDGIRVKPATPNSKEKSSEKFKSPPNDFWHKLSNICCPIDF